MIRVGVSLTFALIALSAPVTARAVLFQYEGTIDRIVDGVGQNFDPTDLFSVGSPWRLRIDPAFSPRLEVELGDYFFAAEGGALFLEVPPGGGTDTFSRSELVRQS